MTASPSPVTEARHSGFTLSARLQRLLDLAYQRPCFVCEKQGICRHREPDVELAYFGIGWHYLRGYRVNKP